VILRKEGAEAQQAGMVNKIYDVHVSGW